VAGTCVGEGCQVTSGGKRGGAGRPVTPDDERLDTIIRVRVTNDQAAELKALKDTGGHNARDVLLAGIAALTPRRSRRTPR
jgi:hypothetical protein